MKRRVLLIEDDPGYACLVSQALGGALELEVQVVSTAGEALRILSRERPDLVVLDRTLPDGDGLTVLRALRGEGRATPVVLLTANSSLASAVEAMKAGAAEYLVKDAAALDRMVRVVLGIMARLPERQPRRGGVDRLVGSSAPMCALRESIRQCAGSDACVLIEGETGVGKELVAGALHAESARAAAPFLAINCGALPEPLVESELFGHVRGAFTGAHRDHIGILEQAARGTLFLDEVEDLPLSLQGKLLRLLQESEYRPLGSTRVKHADVRVIAASNADLSSLVEERRFRRDLYYRLNVLKIRVPALRDRSEDLPALIAHFLAHRTEAGSREQAMPSAEQLAELACHRWPGNVRELANLVERLLVFGASRGWQAAWLMALGGLTELAGERLLPWKDPTVDTAAHFSPANPERAALLRLLERHRWRRESAARELGISRVTLWRRMRRLGLGAAPILDNRQG